MWPSFFDDSVDPLTKILGLKMRPGVRASVLLPGIVVSVYPFIVIEIDVFFFSTIDFCISL